MMTVGDGKFDEDEGKNRKEGKKEDENEDTWMWANMSHATMIYLTSDAV